MEEEEEEEEEGSNLSIVIQVAHHRIGVKYWYPP